MADSYKLHDYDRYSGNARDFRLWTARFEGALDQLDLLEIADGTTKRTGSDDQKAAYDKKNRKLYQLLLKALDDTTAQRVQADVTPRDGYEAWQRTIELIRGSSTLTLNMVMLELLQLKCDDDGDVIEYLTEQKLLQARLTAGKRGFSDDMMKIVTLAGLSARLKNFRDANLDAKDHTGSDISL